MENSDSILLARIDERTKNIDERTDQILTHQEVLDKAVFVGNGVPSLMTRMGNTETRLDSLEEQFSQYLVVCAECRKIVYTPRSEVKTEQKPEAQSAVSQVTQVALAAIEGKKTITVEKWKFWGAVVAGLAAAALAIIEVLGHLPVK